MRILRKSLWFGLLLLLSSCSSYSSGFTCPDSKGVNCTMLSQIDQMIDNGEIKKLYEKKRKCAWGRCTPEAKDLPRIKTDDSMSVYKVKIERQDLEDSYDDGQDLYS